MTRTVLPGVLGRIASVVGDDAALAIAKMRGGTQVYFPPDPAADHWLCRLIGADAAKRVCEEITKGVGPARVDLPLGPVGHVVKAQAQVDAMLRENRSERDIALATGYSIRQVRRRRAALDGQQAAADDRQRSLF